MKITWYGQSCFRVKCKKLSVIIDPYQKKVGFKMPRLKADAVLVTHDHFDHNNVKAISGQPFQIKGSGEYELKNVFIYGQGGYHDPKEGVERGAITMYLIEERKIRLAHLGDLGQKKLTDEQLSFLSNVDVLLIPVGGKYTIDGAEAANIVNEIEPAIVIPMHYKIPGLKIDIETADKFVKEMGVSPQKMDELNVAKSNLSKEELQLVILNKR